MQFKRIFFIVLDSLGVGAMPDAINYNDNESVNTLKSVLNSKKNIKIPNLIKLGLANLLEDLNFYNTHQKAIVSKMAEISNGKDTMTGHWEFMGIKTTNPFVTFTDTGFPEELIKELEEKTGYKVIGNKAASGTEIIEELGQEQLDTKALIVYTSADSVLQIAAHEELFGLDEIYRCCKIAREITMKKEWLVGRVIARPFIGEVGSFKRTANRHDYAIKPPQKTILNNLQEAGYETISIGKIYDIFDGYGLSESNKTKSNKDGMIQTIEMVKNRDFEGLCFVNLVDFDALYGHRRNALGYAKCLEEFDEQLGELLHHLKDDDLLILSADHGNDPNFEGSDHTREYVPLVLYYNNMPRKEMIDVRKSFGDIGATIAKNFNVEQASIGKAIDID